MAIESVAVIGAGTMGNGIAQVFAHKGFPVTMIDIKQEFVDKGAAAIDKSLSRLIKKERITEAEKGEILGRVTTSTKLAEAGSADLVVEAIFEDFEVKKKVAYGYNRAGKKVAEVPITEPPQMRQSYDRRRDGTAPPRRRRC